MEHELPSGARGTGQGPPLPPSGPAQNQSGEAPAPSARQSHSPSGKTHCAGDEQELPGVIDARVAGQLTAEGAQGDASGAVMATTRPLSQPYERSHSKNVLPPYSHQSKLQRSPTLGSVAGQGEAHRGAALSAGNEASASPAASSLASPSAGGPASPRVPESALDSDSACELPQWASRSRATAPAVGRPASSLRSRSERVIEALRAWLPPRGFSGSRSGSKQRAVREMPSIADQGCGFTQCGPGVESAYRPIAWPITTRGCPHSTLLPPGRYVPPVTSMEHTSTPRPRRSWH